MRTFRQPLIVFLMISIAITVISLFSKTTRDDASDISISEWSIAWTQQSELSSPTPPQDRPWHSVTAEHPLTSLPEGAAGAWVHIPVPPTSGFHHPGLYIERLYGLDVTVYEDGRAIFRSARNYDFERRIILVPLNAKAESLDLYIHIVSKEGAGISSPVRIGEFSALSSLNVRKGLPNVLLGVSIAFLGLILLVSTGFVVRNLTKTANALSLFILSTGMLIITNSSLPYFYYPHYGKVLFFLFDAFLLVLLPSLYYFVVHSFEETYAWFRKSEKWLLGYYAVSFLVMAAYKIVGGSFYFYYKLFTFWILAVLALIQLIVIIVLAIRNALRGYRDSMLLSAGILGLAVSGAAELLIFSFRHGPHEFVWWKFGLVFLIACLVMTLNRKIAADYERLLSYSKELELYNHQLQKTERMQIISELAASIAHEIRNPLQVTRGFLQLLSGKASEQNKYQYSMAISELDRAAGIITDYLTFAKPEQETPVLMDVKQELNAIETILRPMVTLNGGELLVNASEQLTISGNPPKFKQALINMLKNSVESLQDAGKIEVVAYEENGAVVIRITDNGQGMDEEQLAKLGNPYFSTKTKGTGLGLMVTFRIIEVMLGTLEFRSEKGKGTEATIRFPLAGAN
ncbi:HAMP domain-containing sensor histidine kinase [Cohnella sp. REN36]|uniref:sensor histidine kinase n=1 Tax=Cohnella sp. REN36 TaxID=2887347 RepID=UPI001D15A06D|nr:HAMP domain-containing sensor histidine kinase [Cohnella sp. REN36]MCC3374249.1 sensor histidine kinase [Cohnella sp. REN36]